MKNAHSRGRPKAPALARCDVKQSDSDSDSDSDFDPIPRDRPREDQALTFGLSQTSYRHSF